MFRCWSWPVVMSFVCTRWLTSWSQPAVFIVITGFVGSGAAGKLRAAKSCGVQ